MWGCEGILLFSPTVWAGVGGGKRRDTHTHTHTQEHTQERTRECCTYRLATYPLKNARRRGFALVCCKSLIPTTREKSAKTPLAIFREPQKGTPRGPTRPVVGGSFLAIGATASRSLSPSLEDHSVLKFRCLDPSCPFFLSDNSIWGQ